MSKKKKAIVLTADKFEDMEVYVPIFRLLEEGWQVDVAAPTKKAITGENGYSLGQDKTIAQDDLKEYDLLIIPGCEPDGAPDTVRKIKKAQEITKYFFEKNLPVASICHGPWTLADAGVIKGRRLTSFWYDGVPESVKEAGGIWENKPV